MSASAPGAAASRLLVVTGEASGDQHGARLVSELRRLEPSVEVYGVGAEQLEDAGVELIGDARTISVIGLFEALRILPQAFRLQRAILDAVERRRPDVALLIDSPDFNLRLAQKLKRRGIRVVYYISPQVWAWRQSRVHQIRRIVDRMLVLFPFEEEFYRRHGVAVDYVGHPLVDEVPSLPQAWDEPEAGETGSPRTVVLLPGSRRSEVARLLPLMLATAKELLADGVVVRLVVAPTLDENWMREQIVRSCPDMSENVELVQNRRFQTIANSHAAICASGTATLEVGLLRTPMVVVYRVNRLTYALGRRLVKVPHIALVNLVLGRRAVPELLQDEANPDTVTTRVRELLSGGPTLVRMRSNLASLRHLLGTSGASSRAAEVVFEELQQATAEVATKNRETET